MGDSRPRTIRLDDLIFKATDALLIGPDYTAIMQICDVLNNRKERVPLAVGVFKERLKHREKDVVLRTLELLDAVTKNVPESVQFVGSKDFLSVLRKMVTNKKTEFLVKETTLSYIQSCALAFKHKSGIHFYDTYEALRKEGISFPPPETEATKLFKAVSPVQSPQVPLDRHRHRQQQQQQHQEQQQQKQMWAEQAAALSGAHAKTTGQGSGRKKTTDGGRRTTREEKEEKLVLAFSSSGLAGLEQELSLLQNSIDLAEEILRNARSKTELHSNDVFAQVFSACQAALPQVQTLLAVPSPPMAEDMVAALLFTNDRLLAVQALHQGLVSGRATDRPVSSDEEEEEDSFEDESAGVLTKSARVAQPSQTESAFSMLAQRGAQHRAQQQQQQQQREEEIPPLLRAPPRARSTSSSTPVQLVTATSHRPQPTGAAAGQTNLLGSPSPSTDDLLDEFATLALRHQHHQQQPSPLASPFATPPALSAALLPPQPYAMSFPGGYAPAPMALHQQQQQQQPSPSTSNQAFPLSPPPYAGGGGSALFSPAPAASTFPASPTAAPNPFLLSGGSAPFAADGTPGLPAYSSLSLLPAASGMPLAGSITHQQGQPAYPPPSASAGSGGAPPPPPPGYVFYTASSPLSSASPPPYAQAAALMTHQPPAWGAAHTAAPQAAPAPSTSSLQDDFDLLFGKRQ